MIAPRSGSIAWLTRLDRLAADQTRGFTARDQRLNSLERDVRKLQDERDPPPGDR